MGLPLKFNLLLSRNITLGSFVYWQWNFLHLHVRNYLQRQSFKPFNNILLNIRRNTSYSYVHIFLTYDNGTTIPCKFILESLGRLLSTLALFYSGRRKNRTPFRYFQTQKLSFWVHYKCLHSEIKERWI